MTGSSKLDEEQQEFYMRRFGVRYHAVQQQPQVPSRAARRKARFRPKAER